MRGETRTEKERDGDRKKLLCAIKLQRMRDGEDEMYRINLFPPTRARDSILKIARECVYNRIAIVSGVVVDAIN